MSGFARRFARVHLAASALAALLAVPAAHGGLAHGLDPCSAPAADACQLGTSAGTLNVDLGGELCPLCLASSQSRTLLQRARPAPAKSLTPETRTSLPPAPAPPTPLARTVAAPRAPPASR